MHSAVGASGAFPYRRSYTAVTHNRCKQCAAGCSCSDRRLPSTHTRGALPASPGASPATTDQAQASIPGDGEGLWRARPRRTSSRRRCWATGAPSGRSSSPNQVGEVATRSAGVLSLTRVCSWHVAHSRKYSERLTTTSDSVPQRLRLQRSMHKMVAWLYLFHQPASTISTPATPPQQ